MGNGASFVSNKKEIFNVDPPHIIHLKKIKDPEFSPTLFPRLEWHVLKKFANKFSISQADLVRVYNKFINEEEDEEPEKNQNDSSIPTATKVLKMDLDKLRSYFDYESRLQQELFDLFIPSILLKQFNGLDIVKDTKEITFTRFVIMIYLFSAQSIIDLVYDFISILKRNYEINLNLLVPFYPIQQVLLLLLEELPRDSGCRRAIDDSLELLSYSDYIYSSELEKKKKFSTYEKEYNKNYNLNEVRVIEILEWSLKYPALFYAIESFRKKLRRIVFGDIFWNYTYEVDLSFLKKERRTSNSAAPASVPSPHPPNSSSKLSLNKEIVSSLSSDSEAPLSVSPMKLNRGNSTVNSLPGTPSNRSGSFLIPDNIFGGVASSKPTKQSYIQFRNRMLGKLRVIPRGKEWWLPKPDENGNIRGSINESNFSMSFNLPEVEDAASDTDTEADLSIKTEDLSSKLKKQQSKASIIWNNMNEKKEEKEKRKKLLQYPGKTEIENRFSNLKATLKYTARIIIFDVLQQTHLISSNFPKNTNKILEEGKGDGNTGSGTVAAPLHPFNSNSPSISKKFLKKKGSGGPSMLKKATNNLNSSSNNFKHFFFFQNQKKENPNHTHPFVINNSYPIIYERSLYENEINILKSTFGYKTLKNLLIEGEFHLMSSFYMPYMNNFIKYDDNRMISVLKDQIRQFLNKTKEEESKEPTTNMFFLTSKDKDKEKEENDKFVFHKNMQNYKNYFNDDIIITESSESFSFQHNVHTGLSEWNFIILPPKKKVNDKVKVKEIEKIKVEEVE